MTVNGLECKDQKRDGDDDKPRSMRELRNDENDQHDSSCDSPKQIHDERATPSPVALRYFACPILLESISSQPLPDIKPMFDHPRLRKGEREKDPDGIEWYQAA